MRASSFSLCTGPCLRMSATFGVDNTCTINYVHHKDTAFSMISHLIQQESVVGVESRLLTRRNVSVLSQKKLDEFLSLR